MRRRGAQEREGDSGIHQSCHQHRPRRPTLSTAVSWSLADASGSQWRPPGENCSSWSMAQRGPSCSAHCGGTWLCQPVPELCAVGSRFTLPRAPAHPRGGDKQAGPRCRVRPELPVAAGTGHLPSNQLPAHRSRKRRASGPAALQEEAGQPARNCTKWTRGLLPDLAGCPGLPRKGMRSRTKAVAGTRARGWWSGQIPKAWHPWVLGEGLQDTQVHPHPVETKPPMKVGRKSLPAPYYCWDAVTRTLENLRLDLIYNLNRFVLSKYL